MHKPLLFSFQTVRSKHTKLLILLQVKTKDGEGGGGGEKVNLA